MKKMMTWIMMIWKQVNPFLMLDFIIYYVNTKTLQNEKNVAMVAEGSKALIFWTQVENTVPGEFKSCFAICPIWVEQGYICSF